jgi:hypothetical protein
VRERSKKRRPTPTLPIREGVITLVIIFSIIIIFIFSNIFISKLYYLGGLCLPPPIGG